MKSATVNPIPATAPAPSTWRDVRPAGSSTEVNRVSAMAASHTPTGLPITRPATTPIATRELTASPTASPERVTPALARAKIGMMTKLVHGASRPIRRPVTGTDSRIFHPASRRSVAVADSPDMKSSTHSNAR